MSGKKPPRPLAKPAVPRQRRETPPRVPRPVTPPPRPPPPPAPLVENPGRPRVIGVVLAALGVLALLAVTVLLVLRGDETGPTTGSRNSPVPEPPSDLAPGTSYVDTRVTADGDLVVRQWLHGSSDMFGVELAPPSSVTARRVTDVRVVAGERPAPGPEVLQRGRGSFAFAGSRDVFVTYRISGAVERSASAPGRALVRFTSLAARARPETLATTYAVSGGDVLALACAPDEPDAVPVPCGAPAGRGWRVERAGENRDDVVIAQLDLP